MAWLLGVDTAGYKGTACGGRSVCGGAFESVLDQCVVYGIIRARRMRDLSGPRAISHDILDNVGTGRDAVRWA